MGDTGRSSILVHILVVALCLAAFGFAVAAERRRSTKFLGALAQVGLNIALLVLLISFLFTTKPLTAYGCYKMHVLRAPLAPGGSRAWSIIYFTSSWITFAIAEACLIAGATKNAYHTKYRDMVYAGNWTCQSLRKGVFIAGAVFVVFTMILDVYFYMYYAKATDQAAKRTLRQPQALA